jgi:hypothetical protein
LPPIIAKLVVATIALMAVAGCRRAPELTPRLILQGEPVGREFWLDAPYVLVVKILRADLDGSRRPIFPGGPKSLQLVKFTANVENAIKGNLPEQTVSFFFFADIDQKPYYGLDSGKRYIVSLRSEGGVLRSFADASQLKIEVHSGSHRQRDLPLDLGLEATIAYILLTPGADSDLADFQSFLDWPPYGEPGYINQRLRELLSHPDRSVRDSACITSARIFWHRPECLKRCLDSPEIDVRRHAEKFLHGDDVNLLGHLQNNPSSLFPEPRNYIVQMFEIYTEDIRPEVRQAACRFLHSAAPAEALKYCR